MHWQLKFIMAHRLLLIQVMTVVPQDNQLVLQVQVLLLELLQVRQVVDQQPLL